MRLYILVAAAMCALPIQAVAQVPAIASPSAAVASPAAPPAQSTLPFTPPAGWTYVDMGKMMPTYAVLWKRPGVAGTRAQSFSVTTQQSLVPLDSMAAALSNTYRSVGSVKQSDTTVCGHPAKHFVIEAKAGSAPSSAMEQTIMNSNTGSILTVSYNRPANTATDPAIESIASAICPDTFAAKSLAPPPNWIANEAGGMKILGTWLSPALGTMLSAAQMPFNGNFDALPASSKTALGFANAEMQTSAATYCGLQGRATTFDASMMGITMHMQQEIAARGDVAYVLTYGHAPNQTDKTADAAMKSFCPPG